jgi:atypical dual specificity phosphatase
LNELADDVLPPPPLPAAALAAIAEFSDLPASSAAVSEVVASSNWSRAACVNVGLCA